ncbi:endonuclease-reverse transcriptase [Plakobranchus ocellatus]|uniref:Endonuclease-reverse transcriptase n=1 Tax=Plakobranchus ocellatus TaxID=259542 RepID=A0AAV3ZIN4_9GAST|nr:endonuclease-reverse transcriptase [Plakobranchus ocellatus]
MTEIETAIRKLKNGKSPGMDNIPSELLKACGNNALKAIHKLCTTIWNTCRWPTEWKEQELIMLYKAGDAKECSNYRTIALISHTSKIMLYIILERIKTKVEEELAEEQAGFRPGRGTGDMLCAIQVMLEKIIDFHKEAFIIFIDYSKAFDSIMRDTEMERYGIVVGGRKISNLRYADDTAICANNQTEATTLMNELNGAGERKSLKLNAKKTKYMHIGKEQHASITIGNEEIECVEHFKFLGSIKTDTADCSIDVNTRIGMAKKRMIDLNNIWKDKYIGKQLKIKLVKCLVWTVMTYGAEGWTLRKRDEKKINSAEMWFYRRLLRVS